jgi:hypothetical protein
VSGAPDITRSLLSNPYPVEPFQALSREPSRASSNATPGGGLQDLSPSVQGYLHRSSRRWDYAFGSQNCLHKLGFRVAIGIAITPVLVSQI